MIRNKTVRIVQKHFFMLTLCVLMAACAQTKPVLEKGETPAGKPVVFPEYNGPKTPLAVLPMGLSKRAAERYPHLLEKSVGLGVHNILTDALYRTKRFRFVEDKESTVKKALNWQKLGASGLVDQDSAVSIGKILGARKVIYGEIFDYSEGKTEKIVGLTKATTPHIRVGVQIRLIDIETLEYIPASSIEYGSDWGEASRAAIESAVLSIAKNIE